MNSIGFEPTSTWFALHPASQALDMSSKVIAQIFAGRRNKDIVGLVLLVCVAHFFYETLSAV